jgi:hypothetical protein
MSDKNLAGMVWLVVTLELMILKSSTQSGELIQENIWIVGIGIAAFIAAYFFISDIVEGLKNETQKVRR